MSSSPETDQSTDTQTAIMEATYNALTKHGYADLTIDKIADEFDKSKSLLYYHYDTKDEILLNLLEFLLDQFAVEDAVDPDDDPDIQLQTFIEGLLPWTLDEDEHEFQTAVFGLRSQALLDEAYREQFTRADDLLCGTIVDLIEDGIEEGTFQKVNADRVAEHLYSTINGAILRRLTAADDGAIRMTRQELSTYVESRLLADR